MPSLVEFRTGQRVGYTTHHDRGSTDWGIVKSISDKFVFVVYDGDSDESAKATRPEDLIIATVVYRCSSSPYGNFTVTSYTDPNKSYDVYLPPTGMNTCTCIAFAMKRNKLGGYRAVGTPECTCKHIAGLQARRSGCGWSSETHKFHEVNGVEVTNICPHCWSETTSYDPRDPEIVDLDELMADYIALKKKLERR